MLLDQMKNLKEKLQEYDFLSSKVEDLEKLIMKYEEGNLQVAVIGEYSSGKTSLINGVFGLSLSTDILPETSSIWKIYLTNSDQSTLKFKVNLLSGESKWVNSVTSIREFDIKNIKDIELRIFHSELDKITIVDTPGLSSLDESHREILENYIKEADVILVVVDINQGDITNTMEKFIDKFIDHQSLYVVLTKKDQKSPSGVRKVKKHIKDRLEGKVKDVMVVSSKTGECEDVENLLRKLWSAKMEILEERVSNGFKLFCADCLGLVVEQIKNAGLDLTEINKKRDEYDRALWDLKREISDKRRNFKQKIEEIERKAVEKFHRFLLERKEYIVEAIYDKNLSESVNDRFNKVVKEGMEEALVFVEMYLRKNFDLKDGVYYRTSSLNVGGKYLNKGAAFTIADLAVNIRESIVAKLIGYVGGGIWGVLIQQGVVKITEALTKPSVSKKIENNIDRIKEDFATKLREILELEVESFIDKTLADLENRKKELEQGLGEIESIKREKKEELDNYLENLKALERELKNYCGRVSYECS